MTSYNKVFGLGLSRTGTTSLHASALLLGISAIHYPLECARRWIGGNFSKEFFGPFTFYTDLPVPVYFREFDSHCPNSKFILTIRDPKDWVTSVERFLKQTRPSSNKTLMRDINRVAVYGVVRFHRERFINVYNRHCEDVINYFRNRKDDLLVINITKEVDPWIPLCEFLNVDIPKEKYPHLRSPNLRELQYVLPEELDSKKSALQKLLSAEADI